MISCHRAFIIKSPCNEENAGVLENTVAFLGVIVFSKKLGFTRFFHFVKIIFKNASSTCVSFDPKLHFRIIFMVWHEEQNVIIADAAVAVIISELLETFTSKSKRLTNEFTLQHSPVTRKSGMKVILLQGSACTTKRERGFSLILTYLNTLLSWKSTWNKTKCGTLMNQVFPKNFVDRHWKMGNSQRLVLASWEARAVSLLSLWEQAHYVFQH